MHSGQYKEKIFSHDILVFLGMLTFILIGSLLFIGDTESFFGVLSVAIFMVLLISYLWLKKYNIILQEDGVILEPVLKKYLSFLKSKEIKRAYVNSYSFKANGLVEATLYNNSYQLIVNWKDHQSSMLFYSPLQDMSHFKEDVIECLGKEKLVEEMPL